MQFFVVLLKAYYDYLLVTGFDVLVCNFMNFEHLFSWSNCFCCQFLQGSEFV